MSLRLAAMFVECAYREKDPKEALRALHNAWCCSGLPFEHKKEIVAIQRVIAREHPEASNAYGHNLETMMEQEMELLRKARRGR